MHSVSALVLLAVASHALAGPLGHQHMHRALRIDNVIVTHEIVVTQYPDGIFKTADPKVVGIETIVGKPKVETQVKPVTTIGDLPTSTSVAVPISTPKPAPSSSSTPAPAVFKEVAPSSSPPAPVPTTTTVQIEEPAPVVAPTTFAKVVSSAAAVVSSLPDTAAGGKRGIAYNDAAFLPAFVGAKGISWCYNWGGNTATVPDSFEFVPMLWGLGEHANNWERYADTAIAAGSKHLLAFNEPDHGEQASTEPGVAAAGYKQYMEPYAGKAKLGSPAVTNGGGEMGLTWLGNFMTACSGCTIDFVNVHWYNGGDAAAFKTHMESAYKVGGNRPVWVTEFQAPGSPAEQVAFLADVLPWMDSQDWIARYSLFMASEGNMMKAGGLSDIGKAFVS